LDLLHVAPCRLAMFRRQRLLVNTKGSQKEMGFDNNIVVRQALKRGIERIAQFSNGDDCRLQVWSDVVDVGQPATPSFDTATVRLQMIGACQKGKKRGETEGECTETADILSRMG